MANADSTKAEVVEELKTTLWQAQSICALIKAREEEGGEASDVGNCAGVVVSLLNTAQDHIEALNLDSIAPEGGVQ